MILRLRYVVIESFIATSSSAYVIYGRINRKYNIRYSKWRYTTGNVHHHSIFEDREMFEDLSMLCFFS